MPRRALTPRPSGDPVTAQGDRAPLVRPARHRQFAPLRLCPAQDAAQEEAEARQDRQREDAAGQPEQQGRAGRQGRLRRGRGVGRDDVAGQGVQKEGAVLLGGPAGDAVGDAHHRVVLGHGADEHLVVVVVAQGEDVQPLPLVLFGDVAGAPLNGDDALEVLAQVPDADGRRLLGARGRRGSHEKRLKNAKAKRMRRPNTVLLPLVMFLDKLQT